MEFDKIHQYKKTRQHLKKTQTNQRHTDTTENILMELTVFPCRQAPANLA